MTATTAALHEHRDDVVQAWRKPFDTDAATFLEPHGVLGGADLGDHAAILGMGAAAADTWGAARKAVATIRGVGNGWTALAGLPRPARPRPVAAAPRRRERNAGPTSAPRKADPWAALAAGLELTLPTLREYVDRNQAIDQYLATPVTAIDTQRSGVAGREIRVPVA